MSLVNEGGGASVSERWMVLARSTSDRRLCSGGAGGGGQTSVSRQKRKSTWSMDEFHVESFQLHVES